jgi:hypothetical protein
LSKHCCIVTRQYVGLAELGLALGTRTQDEFGGTGPPPKKSLSPDEPGASLASSFVPRTGTKMSRKKTAQFPFESQRFALGGIKMVWIWSDIALLGFVNVCV